MKNKNKNKLISASLRRFHKKKKFTYRLKMITVVILITAGLLTTGYQAIMQVKFKMMVVNTSNVEAITEDKAKEIYGGMVGFIDDMEATASVPVNATGEAVQQPFQPVVPTDKQKIKEQIKNTFPTNYKIAIAIAKCESQLNCKAIGDTTTKYQSTGLFQIRELPKRMKYYNLTTEKLQDSTTNILMAHIIYNRSGWYPWTCFTNKKYKDFL